MLSAAILAGGRAVRFGGRDKSALVVDGQSIFERQMAILSAVADEVLVVGGPARPGVRTLPDVIRDCGPLGGLHTALTYAKGDVALVVSCDMPFVTAPLLSYLAGLASGEEGDAVVPRTERGYHPLCAAYTRRCLEPVTRRLEAKRLKMTDLLADIRVRVVTADELDAFGGERLLVNVNTPDEYHDLARSHEL